MVNLDSITEVTSEGMGSRLMNSIKGVLAGLVLIAGSIGLLWWNEGRTVHMARDLEEAGGKVISVSSESIDQANEGKLIHVTGDLTTEEILRDSSFGIEGNAIHLTRSVEMYQWEEKEESKTEKKLGGGTETKTTYSYSKGWSSFKNDSSKFKKPEGHTNPSMPYQSSKQSAGNVQLNAFKLSSELISMFGGGSSVELTQESLAKLSPALKGKTKLDGNTFYISQKGTPDPSAPEVGDMKVSFGLTKPGPASVIGVQTGNSFTGYTGSNGNTIIRLENGIQTAASMIASAQSENTMWGWILRVAGLLAMTAGFSMIFKPIAMLGDVVPFIGSALEFGFGIISFILSFVISMIVIAIAWIFYRPLLGIGLLVVAAAGIGALIYMKKQKSAAA